MTTQRRSRWFPLATTVLAMAGVVWQVGTEHVVRVFAVPAMVVSWGVLVAMWWALGPGSALVKWLRVAVVVAGVVMVVAGIRYLVRYEGSASGSALPQLAWRWTPKAERERGLSEPEAGVGEGEVAAVEGAEPFLRFMGVDGDGFVAKKVGSADWDANPPVERWRIEVGDGWSGFVVEGGRAYTQEQRGENECVTCYELATGKLLWLSSIEARFDEAMGGIGPRATPTLDPVSGRLYTQGSTGMLQCLEARTGEVVWAANVLEIAGVGNLEWGKSNGPLLDKERVIVNGGKGGAALLVFSAADGRLLWKQGHGGGSYSSPVFRELGGERQLVSVNPGSVTGHDPETGVEWWRFDWPGTMPKVGQPIAAGEDRLLVTASYGMGSHLIEVKRGPDEKWTAAAVWSESAPRTKFSSASVVGEHVYALDEGRLVCVSLATGERVWREGRYGYGQHLLWGEDLLLIQSEPGDVVLVRANPEGLEEVGRMAALGGKTWNPPTLAGRYLLVRNDREAVCFELGGE